MSFLCSSFTSFEHEVHVDVFESSHSIYWMILFSVLNLTCNTAQWYSIQVLHQLLLEHSRSLSAEHKLIGFTRIVYNGSNSSFENLLAKSGSVSRHHRNSRVKEKKYNLRNKNALVSNIPHSTNYGINTISHLAPKICEIISNEIRCCQSLNLFKEKIKTWIPINCPCNLCRPYVHKAGFI